MGAVTDLLAAQMDEAFTTLRRRLDGLSDDEFFWEPVPHCWTVFRGDDGRWTYQYEEPDPQPAPFTTIGWRLVHVALCKVMYHEWAFGRRELTFITIENPHDVASSISMLDRGHKLLVGDLATLDDASLDRPVLTNWGEEWPARRIFTTMTGHDAHHGGEIGALRDLYRATGGRTLQGAG
jgi:hypothetical protein